MSRTSQMSPRRLAWVLRARGPELCAWPERERLAALALVRRDPAARQLLAEALSAEEAPPPDPAAAIRIQNTIHRALAPLSPLLRGIRWGVMAACVLAGLYAGLGPLAAETAAETSADLAPTIQATTSGTVLAALDP